MTISEQKQDGRSISITDRSGDQIIAVNRLERGDQVLYVLTTDCNQDRVPIFSLSEPESRDQIRTFGEALIRWAETGSL